MLRGQAVNVQKEIRVVGEGDLRGHINPADLDAADEDGTVRIWLGEGGAIAVPFRTLQKQDDDSYYVPLSREALEGIDVSDENRSVLIVPVIEEQVEIHKRQVTTGRVRLTRQVSEREEVIEESAFRETIEVERVPVNELLDSPVGVRYEGDTMIIPVMEEQVVVEKRWLLREEVRVTKRRTQIGEPQHVTLHKEQVSVERLEPNEPGDDLNSGPSRPQL
jgi:uncharacterized protein (TIGR02271 family)